MKISFESIGVIKTPYEDDKTAPRRPDLEAQGTFSIFVDRKYKDALKDLDQFSHLIVFFHFSRSEKTNLLVHPPHMNGKQTGLFASRSPNRINKIGMDVVRILSIEENVIHTSPMDILNNTPLLDIKPYIPSLDCHPEATKGHTK